MITPTTITTQDQIYLTGSPINLKLQNVAKDITIKSAVCEVYVWNGNLNTPPTLPNYTLVADKVSSKDNYINFQVAEIIQSHITGTKFAWQSGDGQPSIAGEGVFFHYRYQITNQNVTIETAVESYTGFATLGYRLDYEQVGSTIGQPYLGLVPINYSRNYAPQIKYYKREFDFTKSLGICTSENFIKSTQNVPTVTKCQLGEKFLVVYINRLGVWDYFTPYGKVIKSFLRRL